MSSSKIINLQVKGLCGKCFTVWGPEPQIPPLHTVLYTCIQYTYSLFTQGRGEGGRVEPERRGEGQHKRVQITELGWQYQHDWMYTRNRPNMTECTQEILVGTLWYIPAAKSFYRSIFQMTTFCIAYESFYAVNTGTHFSVWCSWVTWYCVSVSLSLSSLLSKTIDGPESSLAGISLKI